VLSANELQAAINCPFKFIAPLAETPSRPAGDGFAGCVVFKNYPVLGFFSDDVLSLKKGTNALSNGTFVQYEDHSVTLGPTTPGGFLVSDRFGGCDFTILKDPNGRIVGAHVFNDGPQSTTRAAIRNLPPGWSHIGTWESMPYLDRWGPRTSLLAFAFPNGALVKIVAVGVAGFPPKVSEVELAGTFQIPSDS
jgi:hypothetical protein